RLHLVAPYLIQHTQYVTALHLGKGQQLIGVFTLRLCRASANPFRQIAHVDHRAFAHHASTAEDTPQLSDVAWPRIPREHYLGARSDAFERLAVLFRE